MADTAITLTPSVAHASGACTVTASAALFTAADVGRLVGILHKCSTERVAATAYTAGQILIAEFNQVPRLYRVTRAGTTAAATLAGTTPDYDLDVPNEAGPTIIDGSAVLKYLGPGRHVWGWATITAFTSTTVVDATIHPRGPFAATTASLRWRLGEFSAARGWPAAGTFHKGRLWIGGTATRPQTLWASETGDFDSFAPTEADGAVLDTNAIAITLDDDQVNTIRWLVSAPRGLAVGVASGEFLVAGINRNAALAPGNVGADRQGDRGSDAGLAPQRISGVVLFAQRGGRRMRQLEYDFGVDRFTTLDLTALADHIAGPGFVETAYADVPDGVFYGLRGDGLIAALTYDTDQKLRAWTLLALGGEGIVESIAAVPDPDGTGSDLYVAVARTVAGVTTRSIEFIRAPFRDDLDAPADAYFVDAGLTYSGTPVNTVTGLAHLEGRTVQIVADGSVRQPQVVTGGLVQISGPAAATVHAGLSYRARIVDLPPEAGAAPGNTAQGQRQRVVNVTLRLLASGGGMVGGRDSDRRESLAFRTLDMAMGEAVPLFTGDRSIAAFSKWGRHGQVEIVHDEPLPFTVLAIIKEMDGS